MNFSNLIGLEAWKNLKTDSDAADRYQFVSFNLDELPDAGESMLRELGLNWPAIRLPDGRENPIYKTYVRGVMDAMLDQKISFLQAALLSSTLPHRLI